MHSECMLWLLRQLTLMFSLGDKFISHNDATTIHNLTLMWTYLKTFFALSRLSTVMPAVVPITDANIFSCLVFSSSSSIRFSSEIN